jgi:hypothetical protein
LPRESIVLELDVDDIGERQDLAMENDYEFEGLTRWLSAKSVDSSPAKLMVHHDARFPKRADGFEAQVFGMLSSYRVTVVNELANSGSIW